MTGVQTCALPIYAEYVITVKNPDGKQVGLSSLTIDGKAVDGDVLPYSPGKHEVVATL